MRSWEADGWRAVLASRRWRARALALIGGVALLMNLAAVVVIACAWLAGADDLPAWLGAAAVGRSGAAGVWGGLAMMRAVGDARWHRTFGAWLTVDLVIAAARPSAPAVALSLAAVVVHLLVTGLHDGRSRLAGTFGRGISSLLGPAGGPPQCATRDRPRVRI